MAFPDGWDRKAELSIESGKVSTSGASGGDLTDFPIVFTEANLPSEIFNQAKADGGDIRFTTDAAGTNPIPAEIVDFDTSGSTAEIWTRAPSLDGSSDELHVWWQNSGASQPASSGALGSEAVWSSDFNAVWHLGESGSTFTDSTSNDNSGSGTDITNAGVNGQIGDAVDLTNNDDAIGTGEHSQFSTSDSFTFTFWWNRDSLDKNNRLFGFDTTDGFGAPFDGGFISGNGELGFRDKPQNVQLSNSDGNNTWFHGAIVHDGSENIQVYLDGSPAGNKSSFTWPTRTIFLPSATPVKALDSDLSALMTISAA